MFVYVSRSYVFVYVSFCLSICWQHDLKSYEWIVMKFYGGVRVVKGTGD